MVTGLGSIAPCGTGVRPFWESLLQARSGIGPITLFDARDFPLRIAGEVKHFNLTDFVGTGVKSRRMARHTQMALASAHLALEHARLDPKVLSTRPSVVLVGVSNSAIDVIEKGIERMDRGGSHRFSSYTVSAAQPHAPASVIADFFGTPSHNQTLSSACAAGLQAVGRAAELIREGKIDVALAGGADAPITPFVVGSFTAAGMLPPTNGDPEKASRPFDLHRAGGIMAEGAGLLVMESLPHALARGAAPLLEILGYGASLDASDDWPGGGFGAAMSQALANAGLHPTELDYVCAHGASDPTLDRVETEEIRSVLGDHAYRIPVSSIKGVIGNPLAAAGPLQVAVCAMAFAEDALPPTANYEVPDPQCDLDYIPGKARRQRIEHALINVHGLGGGNTCMVVKAVRDL